MHGSNDVNTKIQAVTYQTFDVWPNFKWNQSFEDKRDPHQNLAHPQTMLAITHMLDVTTHKSAHAPIFSVDVTLFEPFAFHLHVLARYYTKV